MFAINPVNRLTTNSFQPLARSSRSALVTPQNEGIRAVEQARTNLADAVLFNRLPQDRLHEISNITRHIGTLVLQAAELGQAVTDRELFQEKIRQDTSDLKTVFETLSQDDLNLLAALFQNQSLVGSVDFTTASLDDSAQIFLENLFQFDVTSTSSLLTTLNRTSDILRILSITNFGSDQLEILLETLTGSIYYSYVNNPFAQDQGHDTTGSKNTSENQNNEPAGQENNITAFLDQNRSAASGSDMMTIIELAG